MQSDTIFHKQTQLLACADDIDIIGWSQASKECLANHFTATVFIQNPQIGYQIAIMT
jgi:hypothetical protein